MITQIKYLNKVEHLWYDSSNIIYTACYDNDTRYKTLKAVFKGGRTYLYKDVDMVDYASFSRGTGSTGELFNKNIVKKYKGIRLSDTDLDALEKMRQEYQEADQIIENASTSLAYELQLGDEGKFRLILNGLTIYEGIDGQVNIMRLLNAMHIAYAQTELKDELLTESQFVESQIVEA